MNSGLPIFSTPINRIFQSILEDFPVIYKFRYKKGGFTNNILQRFLGKIF